MSVARLQKVNFPFRKYFAFTVYYMPDRPFEHIKYLEKSVIVHGVVLISGGFGEKRNGRRREPVV